VRHSLEQTLDTRLIGTKRLKRGQSEHRPGRAVCCCITPAEANQSTDHAAAHQTAQIRFDEVLVANHVAHHSILSYFLQPVEAQPGIHPKQLRHHRMQPVIIHSVSGPCRSDNLQMA
jgi:hypothetical protein